MTPLSMLVLAALAALLGVALGRSRLACVAPALLAGAWVAALATL